MPQERQSQYPFPTATEALSAPGDREDRAARNVVSRLIDGIPKRAYIIGEADHAPVVRGVKELVTACYKVLDTLDGRFEDSSESDALDEMRTILEDHRCPPEPEAE